MKPNKNVYELNSDGLSWYSAVVEVMKSKVINDPTSQYHHSGNFTTQPFWRVTINLLLLTLAILFFSQETRAQEWPVSSAPASWGDASISAQAGPSPITISTCSHDAGAICSLTWNGKEFIDDYDHGRQLQSAVRFDHKFDNDRKGEEFNPTEAGAESAYNGINPNPSSSTLQGLSAVGNILSTQTKMAFWIPFNGVAQSNHILNKQVTIGKFGLPHVIEYLTQFHIPADETHIFGQFEVLTGYMPDEFSQFWTLDVKAGATNLVPLDNGPGEQILPVIFSTSDARWAMGIYSPDSPQSQYPGASYGRWWHPDNTNVVKWNNVFRFDNPSGVYNFRSYAIVGSLDDVKVSMQQLNNLLSAGSPACSSVTLTTSTLPSSGGPASAQANCTGSGLIYTWRVNDAAYGGNTSSISDTLGVNSSGVDNKYYICVTATNALGSSQPTCTTLIQSKTSPSVPTSLPPAPICLLLKLSSSNIPAEGGVVSARANCKGVVASYVWTVDGKEISGDLSSNSSSVGLNTTKSPIKYVVCVSARNSGGQSQAVCKTLTHAAAVDPVCSSLTLSPSSLPASGGLVSAQANCTGNGLTFIWRVNGEVYPGNLSTNSSIVGASTTTLPITYTVCVTASSTLGLGQSKPFCTSLTQAGATAVPPSVPIIGSAVVVGSDSVSVSFTPGALGSGTFVNYTAACSGTFASGTTSPIIVTGLLKNSAYFCHVKATTSAGTSSFSDWSNPVFP